MKNTTNRSRYGKFAWLTGCIVVLALFAAGTYVVQRDSHSPKETSQKQRQAPVVATPSKPTVHNPSAATSNVQGGVKDQNGQVSGSLPPASEWKSSASGRLTLQRPVAGTTLSSGASLSGLAEGDVVQFILKDNAVGQIAQGSLAVVDGKFSGILQFTPRAKTGELELYHPNPANGAAEDIINIDVNFKF